MTIEADLPGKPVAIITRRRSYVGPFLGAEVEQWELLERANLDMVFWALQAVLPPMLAGRGQVVVFAVVGRPDQASSAPRIAAMVWLTTRVARRTVRRCVTRSRVHPSSDATESIASMRHPAVRPSSGRNVDSAS